jgi:hypothetical protein
MPPNMEFSSIELPDEPTVSAALLQRLEIVFSTVPSKSMSLRELDQYLGQREVLDYLHRLHEEGGPG